MSIQLLPDDLIARIAAGEVVERPASVVKELIENAIDAGARSIQIECAEGGRRLIRIGDDGSGIRADEAALAFAHHATSKLSAADDLSSIHTLGFRGEALASIASVSQITCSTRHAEETSGMLLRIDNGRLAAQERLGRPAGTTMSVEHLFARVPARLKFLKSIQTERGHIDGMVMRYAMAYPHIRFTLTHDNRRTFQSLGNGNLRDVLIEVYGTDAAEKMVPIGDDSKLSSIVRRPSSVTVRGFVALPEYDHANRSRITLFINGRPVQDVRLGYAVIQAYHTLLMTGRYPVAVVMVELPAEDVDVNVHPAKAEVRFRDADSVFSAVQRAVRRTLLEAMPVPEAPSVFVDRRLEIGGQTTDGSSEVAGQAPLAGAETWERVGIARNAAPPAGASEPPLPTPQPPIPNPQSPLPNPQSPISPSTRPQLPALRILGQLAATYIIAEGPEGLYLVDQHASHERILFERLMAARELGQVPSQALLDPVPVDLPADSVHRLESDLDALQGLGFHIDHFGGNTFLARAVPAVMMQDDVSAALREIVADLEMGDAPLRRDLEARVLRRVCKRMAIKAGRVLTYQEMAALIRDLEACASPRTCPHGRPTMIQIGTAQLEREFGRIV